MARRRAVSIVPHTHWDREWYEPFQAFRHRLVGLLDTVVDLLEATPQYRRFLLDGQTQIVDDYLEMRPEAAVRIEALVRQGRLAIGPWRILMDEAMVSGETLVRNLQMGLARGAALGGTTGTAAIEVGYLPDMFGHVAQMPQLLALAGLRDAVLWRGVPSSITTTAFWWEAPDGSRVRAEYLFGSYANGATIPPTAEGLVDLVRRSEAEVGDGLVGALLLMHGRDHMVPVPWLPDVVAAANAAQDDYDVAIVSLAEHVGAQPRDESLPVWRGELRSSARANVLMGTASNHVDVHRRAAAAERAVERVAEPLAALRLPADAYPHAALRLAWDQLVLNSAHDSACACSHDDTVAAVNVRYAEARHLADAVARDAVTEVAGTPDGDDAFVVVNPTARPRGGVIEITSTVQGAVAMHDATGQPLAAQVVEEQPGDATTTVVQGAKAHWLLALLREEHERGTRVRAVDVEEQGGELHVALHAAPLGDDGVDLEPVLARMAAWAATGGTQRVVAHRAATRTIAVAVPRLEGFGTGTVRVASARPDVLAPTAVTGAPVRAVAEAATVSMTNEHLRVVVDRATGTYALATADGVTASGLGRLVDGGDGGDTYTYSPPPGDVVIDEPVAVTATLLDPGPVRACVEVVATYEWPTHAIGDHAWVQQRAPSTAKVDVHTTLELRTGERFVRVHHAFDNPCRDHRLRVHFPLPRRVDGSAAECAFAVVHRGLQAESGPQERGTPTFVSRRFVDCSDGAMGLAVVHDGLLEYEVVDDGRELAVTLLRATGWLSRAAMAYRAEPAGPFVATPGAQLVGPVEARYAVLPHDGDWHAADLYGVADEVLVPLLAARSASTAAASVAARGAPPLGVDGAEVSAVHRDTEGRLVVRVFRAAPGAGEVRITRRGAAAAGEVIDLRGRVLGAFTGTLRLRAGEIATLRLPT